MTLLEWGALGELIGGVAIIVSLIYVGVQVKESADSRDLRTGGFHRQTGRPGTQAQSEPDPIG